MIDLHTHLLPGVDDGSEQPEQSVAVLKRFEEQGVTAVCCTPHLKASEFADAPCDDMDQLLGELIAVAPPAPRLVRGFEIMLDVPAPIFHDRCLTLNRTRYALVEFGRLVPADASVEALSRIVEQGIIPVLAHPERYACCNLEMGQRWREAGALLQLDATTLLGDSKRAERARDLLGAGYGTIIASDNHGDGRSLAAAVEWMQSHGAREQARLLAYENPGAILSDGPVMIVPPVRLRRSWYSMLKDFVIGGKEQ
ncbi:MAG TPA: CpsB/CapC family capsule biosynthesis tyrosine phosphatase [Gemmatimonadales bacterium]